VSVQIRIDGPAAADGPARQPWLVSGLVAAAAVIAVTVTAQSVGRFQWWAGFVVMPTALVVAAGMPSLARGGSRAFGGYLLACAGVIGFAVGALLMFGAMSDGWPLMITLPALAVGGTYAWRPTHPLARGLHRTVASLAVLAVSLGPLFFLLRADRVDLPPQWWGGYLVAAGIVVAANGLELIRHRMPYRLQAVVLALGPAAVAILLGVRFLRGL
jgi:hypothetical protein